MKKWSSSIFGIAALLVLVSTLHAQAVPTGIRKSDIQVGAGVMILNNDYTDKDDKGISIWGDYDFNRLVGVEVEAHFGTIISPSDIGENSYLVGPRIMYHKRKFTVYGKLMLGRGSIIDQFHNTSSSYNIVPAYGGGLEYRVKERFNIRVVDFELQKWPDFEPNTLSPLAISVGLMYRIR